MVFPSANCSFCSVDSVLVSWCQLTFNVCLSECILEFLGSLIVHAVHAWFETCLTEFIEDTFVSFFDLVGCSILDWDAPDEVGIMCMKK